MTRSEIEKKAEEYRKDPNYAPLKSFREEEAYTAGAIEVSNAQLDELIRRLDAGLEEYIHYTLVKKEIESLKIK